MAGKVVVQELLGGVPHGHGQVSAVSNVAIDEDSVVLRQGPELWQDVLTASGRFVGVNGRGDGKDA
eukprot:8631330-Alexandrium_andersonii.AAC.1